MKQNKTMETSNNVKAFIDNVSDQTKRNDSFHIVEIFKKVTGFEPKMWGASIIGFGNYHYKYESGHEGNAPLTGFSPRKDSIVLYLGVEFKIKDQLLKKFGKHKAGKGCVYIKKLEDIDTMILEKLISASVENILTKYPVRMIR